MQAVEDWEDGALEVLFGFEVSVCQSLEAISVIPLSSDRNLPGYSVSCSRRDQQFRPCSDQSGAPPSTDLISSMHISNMFAH